MAKENFSELSTEDLIKKKKTMSYATGVLAGALIMLLLITIYKVINKWFAPLIVLPFALLPTLIINYNQVKSMDKELKSRNLN